MNRLTDNKIVMVTRKTRLKELLARYNTVAQAQFHIEHLGGDFSDYLAEDEQYTAAVAEAFRDLGHLGRVQTVEREYIPNFIFGESDIVVVVGQDGLVANTMKYLQTQPLLGVNPDSKRWDGILLPFIVSDLKHVVKDVFHMKRPVKQITMANASLNDGQYIYAVNDLFIGQKSHVSSRYCLQVGGQHEFQSSSGVIVSTGLGSTGWLKSVLTGAANIVNSITDKKIHIQQKEFNWASDYLYYSVREPFPSKTSSTQLAFGKVTRDNPLRILSHMPENGVIFSDGVESDFLQFNSGVEAVITVAEKKGLLVV